MKSSAANFLWHEEPSSWGEVRKIKKGYYNTYLPFIFILDHTQSFLQTFPNIHLPSPASNFIHIQSGKQWQNLDTGLPTDSPLTYSRL